MDPQKADKIFVATVRTTSGKYIKVHRTLMGVCDSFSTSLVDAAYMVCLNCCLRASAARQVYFEMEKCLMIVFHHPVQNIRELSHGRQQGTWLVNN